MKLETNGSHHNCNECIHEPYCNQTKLSLINHAKEFELKTLWIPESCPIVKKEKVEFT